jgi:hypothetical protein
MPAEPYGCFDVPVTGHRPTVFSMASPCDLVGQNAVPYASCSILALPGCSSSRPSDVAQTYSACLMCKKDSGIDPQY